MTDYHWPWEVLRQRPRQNRTRRELAELTAQVAKLRQEVAQLKALVSKQAGV